jgi:hypothetical protein
MRLNLPSFLPAEFAPAHRSAAAGGREPAGFSSPGPLGENQELLRPDINSPGGVDLFFIIATLILRLTHTLAMINYEGMAPDSDMVYFAQILSLMSWLIF